MRGLIKPFNESSKNAKKEWGPGRSCLFPYTAGNPPYWWFQSSIKDAVRRKPKNRRWCQRCSKPPLLLTTPTSLPKTVCPRSQSLDCRLLAWDIALSRLDISSYGLLLSWYLSLVSNRGETSWTWESKLSKIIYSSQVLLPPQWHMRLDFSHSEFLIEKGSSCYSASACLRIEATLRVGWEDICVVTPTEYW